MKRLLFGFLLVICLTLVGIQAAWAAASSCTQVFKCFGRNGDVCRVTMTWTAASTDGTFTSTAITAATVAALAGYYLYEMETDPGTTAPTDNYGITLTASTTGYAYDLLGGRGASRSTNTTQAVLPANNTGSRFPPISGTDTLTLAITANSVNSATGVIRFWFVK